MENENEFCAREKKDKKTAVLLILLTTAVYALSNVGRKSYDANINEIMSFFSVSKEAAGLAGTFFFVSYGIGQVVHGLLCTKYNPKYSILLAAITGAFCNLILAVLPQSAFSAVKFVWCVNGFSQAALWSSTVLIFKDKLASRYSALALFIMCFPNSVGTFLAYGLSSLFSYLGVFRLIFYVAFGGLAAISAVWILTYDKLTAKTLESKAFYDGADGFSVADDKKNGEKAKKKNVTVGFIYMFALMSLLAVINNFVKDGLTTWTPTFLKERFGLENWFSVLLTLLLPIAALFGSALSIAMNKKIKDFVLLSGVLYLVSAAAMGIFVAFCEPGGVILAVACFTITACLMAGVNNVVTAIFPMYSKSGINAGFVAGITDGFCYLGSALSSYGFGVIADNFGWNAVISTIFYSLAAATVLCVLCFYLGKVVKKRKKTKNEE